MCAQLGDYDLTSVKFQNGEEGPTFEKRMELLSYQGTYSPDEALEIVKMFENSKFKNSDGSNWEHSDLVREEGRLLWRDSSFWKKSDISKTRRVTPNEDWHVVRSTDMKQGFFPNCFFCASVAAISANPILIERLFLNTNPKNGIFAIRFMKNGQWRAVLVDEYYAVGKGESMSPPTSDGRFWTQILEKAYAKFYSSFESIKGGNILDCTYDLTGCLTTVHRDGLKLNIPKSSSKHPKSVVVCGTGLKTLPSLQKNHAYTLRRVVSQGYVVFNPQVKTVSPSTQKTVKLEEGELLLTNKEFLSAFESYNEIPLVDPSLYKTRFVSKEKFQKGVGSSGFQKTFYLNEIFAVRSSDKVTSASLLIHLSEQRGVSSTTKIAYRPCGISILDGTSEPTPISLAGQINLKGVPLFCNKRENGTSITVTDKWTYFVPSVCEPGEELDYTLSVASDSDVEVKKMSFDSYTTLQHKCESSKGFIVKGEATSVTPPLEIYVIATQSAKEHIGFDIYRSDGTTLKSLPFINQVTIGRQVLVSPEEMPVSVFPKAPKASKKINFEISILTNLSKASVVPAVKPPVPTAESPKSVRRPSKPSAKASSKTPLTRVAKSTPTLAKKAPPRDMFSRSRKETSCMSDMYASAGLPPV